MYLVSDLGRHHEPAFVSEPETGDTVFKFDKEPRMTMIDAKIFYEGGRRPAGHNDTCSKGSTPLCLNFGP